MSDDEFGTQYWFVPSLRRGFQPSDEFTEGEPEATSRATTGIDITPEARPRDDDGPTWEEDDTDRRVNLHVYGPGDVQGIDDGQIARVNPEPETRTFPPNYFPFVEFDSPDLPWRFSPEAADADGRTRPWLTLITVEDTEDVSITVGGNRPCPVLELGSSVDLTRELPDLRESWAWAHAQLHGSPEGMAEDEWTAWASEELTSVSNVTASRILSPRNLRHGGEYIACLVPTFRAGRLAGLGREPFPETGGGGNGNGGNDNDEENDNNGNGGSDPPALQFAWDVESPPPTPFELPLYHYWRFAAAEEVGTFESLATDLHPVELGKDVGMKQVDVSDPGPDSLVPGAREDDDSVQHPVAGALYSTPAKAALTDYEKSDRLRELLNKPETIPTEDTQSYPIVGPPLYGQWHAGMEGIPRDAIRRGEVYDPVWFRELNVEPRNRIAASIGGEVVKEHQQQLMAAAWEVVGEIREANKRTNDTKVTGLLGDSLERREDGTSVTDRVGREDVLGSSARAWGVKAELDRIEALGGLDLGDLVDGGGLGGEGPDRPDEETTQPPPLGRESGQVSGGLDVAPEQRLSSIYARAVATDPLVQDPDHPTPDGGSAKTDAVDASLYTEYLRAFGDQPEASPQYQRLLRRDGPVARREGFADDYYDRKLERVRERTLKEIGALADGLYGVPGDERDDGDAGESEPPGDAQRDPEFVEGVASAAPSGTHEPVGVPNPLDGHRRLGEAVPLVDEAAEAEASRSALDARVPPGSAVEADVDESSSLGAAFDAVDEPQPDFVPEDGTPAAAVSALVSSLLDHSGSAVGLVWLSRSLLENDGTPEGAVIRAYRRAEPITYGLDPLDRELSKAIADDEVAVAALFDDARREESLSVLRTTYHSALARLTAVIEAVEDQDARTDGGSSDEEPVSGAVVDPEEVLPDSPTSEDVIDALDAAQQDLERFREELRFLGRQVRSPHQDPWLPVYVRRDGERPLDPRRPSVNRPDEVELDQRVAGGSELRYRKAILAQRLSYLKPDPFVKGEDPVTDVMAAPEFPTPMWRPLKELNEEYFLPGADQVPDDGVGLVVQNREFIESYMAGLSHEMGRELLWRGFPTDRRGTYFRRFWNKGRGPAWELGKGVRTDDTPSKDIEEIHDWDRSELGANGPGPEEESDDEDVVLLLRSELFRRFPNAVVYAARAKAVQEDDIVEVKPMTPERHVEQDDAEESDDLMFPLFRGNLDPDITFVGFDLTVADVYADQDEIDSVVEDGEVPNEGDDLGWYFVIEERPGETKFGLEVPEDEDKEVPPIGVQKGADGDPYVPGDDDDDVEDAGTDPVGWDDISWAHLVDEDGDPASLSYVPIHDSRPGEEEWRVTNKAIGDDEVENVVDQPFDESDTAEWGKNSAHMGRIAWRKPARVSFHAHELLPDDPVTDE